MAHDHWAAEISLVGGSLGLGVALAWLWTGRLISRAVRLPPTRVRRGPPEEMSPYHQVMVRPADRRDKILTSQERLDSLRAIQRGAGR